MWAVVGVEGVMEGGEQKRERERDTNSLAGLLSGSIMFGELLSTPVWQLHHRGWKEQREWGVGRMERKARKGVVRKPLYLPLVTLFCEVRESRQAAM